MRPGANTWLFRVGTIWRAADGGIVPFLMFLRQRTKKWSSVLLFLLWAISDKSQPWDLSPTMLSLTCRFTTFSQFFWTVDPWCITIFNFSISTSTTFHLSTHSHTHMLRFYIHYFPFQVELYCFVPFNKRHRLKKKILALVQ